jgi:hypothetical protein
MNQKLPFVLILSGIFLLMVFALGTSSSEPIGNDLKVTVTSTFLKTTTPIPNNLKVSLTPTPLKTSTSAPDIFMTQFVATLNKIDEFGGEGQDQTIDLLLNINNKSCLKTHKKSIYRYPYQE